MDAALAAASSHYGHEAKTVFALGRSDGSRRTSDETEVPAQETDSESESKSEPEPDDEEASEARIINEDDDDIPTDAEVAGSDDDDETGPDDIPPDDETEMPVRRPRRVRESDTSDSDVPTVGVKLLRGECASYVRNHMPSCSENGRAYSISDLVSAFIIVKSEGVLDCPADLRPIVNAYKGSEAQVTQVSEQIKALSRKVDKVSRQVTAVECGVAYELYERLGLRQTPIPADASKIRFDVPDTQDITMGLERQSVMLRKHVDARSGRPL